MGSLEGRVALVTGAASGIGRAVATRLAAEGAGLLLADRDAAGLAEVAGRLGARAFAFDAAVPGDAARMVAEAVGSAGRLDILANIAGAYHRAHFTDLAMSEWDRILRVNLTAVAEACQAALPALLARRGVIVNTASTAAVAGIAYAAPYAAAKAGVVALTKTLAAEFAHAGLRVNAVAPGRVRTAIAAGLAPLADARPGLALHPPRLSGFEEGAEPEAVAGLYAWLAGPDAAYVTGQVILADGGWSAG
ncbi:MAG: SDR family oxidoreductase [Rhodobacteraceae bacterium]|nr:SDR family oxidoreductase [Paracoccaceae bacterium]